MNRQPISMPKITALYERISKDDDLDGQSNSIVNQKQLMEEHAAKLGLANIRHFSDDGISGSRFDRPGFLQMMDEIEAGNVQAVLTKDSSRIGRDHLRVGLFLETLRQKGVRFIAPGDNVDTDLGEDDFLPFRNILHEWYVRDTSRKIKTVLHSRGNNGKHMTNTAVYGYISSPDDKNIWLIDEEAANVVRRIFQMTIDGKGPWQIAKVLTDENVTRPSTYIAKRDGSRYTPKGASEPYAWSSATVQNTLDRAEYMGCTVNFRTYKDSYKDKKKKFRPKDEWLIIEGTQEPIVDRETWETAQKCRIVKRRRNSTGEANPFTGLVFCADCGTRMYNHRYGEVIKYDSQDTYHCQLYSKYPPKCTMHYIKTSTLQALTLDAIRAVSGFVKENEDEFVRVVSEAHDIQSAEAARSHQRQLAKHQKRHGDLDSLIKQLYEDKVSGALTSKRFEILSGEYESEQEGLEHQIAELLSGLATYDTESGNTDRFIKIVRKYTDITELNATILNEYIDKIIVHEADKSSGEREQVVDIHFNFIGRIPLPVEEPTQEELEAQEKQRRRREKQREYFQRWAAKNRLKKQQQKTA